jgi:hypothetical protein
MIFLLNKPHKFDNAKILPTMKSNGTIYGKIARPLSRTPYYEVRFIKIFDIYLQ